MNAARFDHTHDSWFSRVWFRHCKRKSHHSKKPISWRLNLDTMTDKSYWLRYIKPCSVALTSGMIFLHVEHGFPIVNASNLSSSTGWKKTTARLAQTNKSYWQRNMISSCTYSQQWNGFKTGFLHKQAGSDWGSIEVRSRSKRTTHPFSQRETRQQADPNSSRQQEEASSSRQKAASRKCRRQQQQRQRQR